MLSTAIAPLLIAQSLSPLATTATTSRAEADDRILIVGRRGDDLLGDVPYSALGLSERDIGNGRPTLSLGEALAQVPGVFVTARGNYAQDTRISIRGFGARSAFGVRGLRIFLDGIPLTLPDGQSQLDSLDLADIGRIEVLRGPAGTLYGNAAGGVLYIESKEAGATPSAEMFNLVGGFGTWKISGSARGRVGDTSVSVFASRTEVDGYRDQSRTEQVVAQGRIESALSEDVLWSMVVQYFNSPTAEDPGGLTLEDYRRNPSSAADANSRFRTGETVSQLQVGSRLAAQLGKHHSLEGSVHAGLRDFSGSIPFRTIDFSRDFFGGLLIYRWTKPDWLGGHRLSLGAEAQAQEDRRGNEGNADGRPNGISSLQQTEQARSLGLFAQERFSPWKPLTLLLSARYDRVDFELDDDLLSDGDDSGRRSFDKFTSQTGVVARFARWLSLFANFSQSYETPTLTELVNSSPDGGLSPDLDAQDALSAELGVRGGLPFLTYELMGYYIDLQNELIPDEDEFNRSIFSNAGSSGRLGAEAYLRVRPFAHLELLASYAWLRARFTDDVVVREDGTTRDGNAIPGLPEHRLFGRVTWDDGRLVLAAEVEWVDARPANDANDTEAPPHTLAELRGGLRFAIGPEWSGDLTVGVRNLFDVRYVDNVRPNASGGRFFEPGPPLHVYGALRVQFESLQALE